MERSLWVLLSLQSVVLEKQFFVTNVLISIVLRLQLPSIQMRGRGHELVISWEGEEGTRWGWNRR